MLTHLPSNKATFTQLVSLFLLKNKFLSDSCIENRNSLVVTLGLLMKFYRNFSSILTVLQFYTQQIYCFGVHKTFSFLHIFFLFIAISPENKRTTPTPQRHKNIFETIAPHAKIDQHLYNVLEDNIMRRLIKTNLAEDVDTRQRDLAP